MRPSDAMAAMRIDPAEAARKARLSYVSDTEPGIGRRRAGRGFAYSDADGAAIRDAETLARIRNLAIPPAWTDVWISPAGNGHIQATGRDQRGRKQYRYHADWTAHRDEAKFDGLGEFARLLPLLRRRVEEDLRRRTLSRERVIASVVWLLDKTLIRIGNDVYAAQNDSYGLTTLRSDHVEAGATTLRFDFKGKSGRAWKLKLNDRRVISVVRRMQELPGERLFQYLDEDGESRHVHSQDVNAYIQDVLGAHFSSRQFRTWGASNDIAHMLVSTERPDGKTAQTRLLNKRIDKIATRLNNTRAVCRRCYIHPAVIECWQDNRLAEEFGLLRKRYRRPLKGLDLQESHMLRWLDTL